jgi:5-methylthioadenosine/S-adenosylhomocysteine deaminase
MLIDKYRHHPLISIAVEPHSPYLCAATLLERAADIARTHDLPLVIHLSETAGEVERIQTQYGCSPVALLKQAQVLGPNLLACHCVALSGPDIELLREFDVKVSHNPESNLKLASGIAPVPELLKAGICVGLGTDGCASNNNLDLFGEMNTAAKLHKVHTGDPTVLDAETVLRMATIDGARALGLGSKIGSLEPGKLADLIVLDPHQPHLTPMYDPASHLVYAASGADVVTTIINGAVVMEARRLATIDLKPLMAKINRIAANIRGN